MADPQMWWFFSPSPENGLAAIKDWRLIFLMHHYAHDQDYSSDFIKGFKDGLKEKSFQWASKSYCRGHMRGSNARFRSLKRIKKIKEEILELRKELVELRKLTREKR